jgi:hypothetical protein
MTGSNHHQEDKRSPDGPKGDYAGFQQRISKKHITTSANGGGREAKGNKGAPRAPVQCNVASRFHLPEHRSVHNAPHSAGARNPSFRECVGRTVWLRVGAR